MFSLHDRREVGHGGDGSGESSSWRPNVPERNVNLGRHWYGRKRKAEVRKARPHGGYDRYAGYDAPVERESEPRQRVDFAVSAFVLGAGALVLAWWPILKYIGLGFAVLAVLVATRELRRHTAASRVRLRGEAAHAERFARTGRLLAVAAVLAVAGNMIWGIKTGHDDHQKASGTATSSVLSDVDVTFGQFTTGYNGIGQPIRQLAVTVRNKTNKTRSFTIQLEALDPSGKTRIASDELLEQSMGPGETRQVAAFQFADPTQTEALKSATFRIANASEK
ncbi:MAG TPA: hypothetical protein VHU88_14310 [Sporichthyaceae bacterium]|jgi:hypothetical protein|nr:hypothetical protein [Sporichthyaceae bacterium]